MAERAPRKRPAPRPTPPVAPPVDVQPAKLAAQHPDLFKAKGDRAAPKVKVDVCRSAPVQAAPAEHANEVTQAITGLFEFMAAKDAAAEKIAADTVEQLVKLEAAAVAARAETNRVVDPHIHAVRRTVARSAASVIIAAILAATVIAVVWMWLYYGPVALP